LTAEFVSDLENVWWAIINACVPSDLARRATDGLAMAAMFTLTKKERPASTEILNNAEDTLSGANLFLLLLLLCQKPTEQLPTAVSLDLRNSIIPRGEVFSSFEQFLGVRLICNPLSLNEIKYTFSTKLIYLFYARIREMCKYWSTAIELNKSSVLMGMLWTHFTLQKKE
jgi:hypothetical protein